MLPMNLWAPPAVMSQQDMIKAWEFNYLMNPFTPARLNSALQLFVDKPDIAFAQAKLESGNFTSKIWIENKNPFGMHQPKNRKNYSIGENRKCAVYKHWFYAVLDYREMQKYYFNKGYDHDYFMAVYCSAKDYRIKVKNLI
jgi:uncharacterized FlgJ-related protein